MTQHEKTAIQQAEKQLEQERKEILQQEVYEYLKSELDEIDRLDANIKEYQTQKRAHEENIKNIKQGNLEAIKRRTQALPYATSWTWTAAPAIGPSFYASYVAGTTVTTASGKTIIF
jgi:hypothetical protein